MFAKPRMLLLLFAAVASTTAYKETYPLRLCNESKLLTITFETDEYPEDTKWALFRAQRTQNGQKQYIVTMPTTYASGYTTPTYAGKPNTDFKDSICLEGLPFAQCYTFHTSDESGDGGGEYTLSLGDGTDNRKVLARRKSSDDWSDCDAEGSYDCGNTDDVTFCIDDDGSEDVEWGGYEDDAYDDNYEYNRNRDRRAQTDKCPVEQASKNNIIKTSMKNQNCGWLRKEKKALPKKGWKYSCLADCQNSEDKFKISKKQTTCEKLFDGKALAGKKLKRMCNKKLADKDCNGNVQRVHDYCPLSCKPAKKGICA